MYPGDYYLVRNRRSVVGKRAYGICLTVLGCGILILTSVHSVSGQLGVSEEWKQKASKIIWIAYSPPTARPDKGIEATPEAVREDLAALRRAGFTGLVTYSSAGLLGRELPALAQSQGFEGVIMGIWNPSDRGELAAAKEAAKIPIVMGFCVGNEGLRQRYQLGTLSAAILELRRATAKPVTTTEIIEEYDDETLFSLGDWVFPNAHPYFHSHLDADSAVRWTKGAYEELKRRGNRFVMLKEVGLPTAGDPRAVLSEEAQDRYYQELAKTDVRFVYFEAFDQPWKTHLPVEPHWGVFKSDRTPKRLGRRLIGTAPPSPAAPPAAFYIYTDAGSSNNHFKPTGYMGDVGDIHINEEFKERPRSGETCTRVVYDAKGKAPHECAYAPPCRWAGVYWQEPPNNWGKEQFRKGSGFDLSRYGRVVFWARADTEAVIEFKVGGIDELYGDSLIYPRSVSAKLGKEWREFEVDLRGADLKHIIGGFCWVTDWRRNPHGVTFYLDDIRFELK